MCNVVEVRGKQEWKDFLGLPDQVYQPGSLYCPPLAIHLKLMLGSLKQPEKHLLVAYQDGKPVARMGIKRHRHGDYDALHFGFFESVSIGPEPTEALFDYARRLYPELTIHGPFQFRMEDPYTGCLVDGFDKDPYFFMSYNPPYYDGYLQKAGLKGSMDLFCYEFVPDRLRSNAVRDKAQAALEHGFTLRTLNKLKMGSESKLLASIFNDALSDNWGYEVLEKDQVDDLITLAFLFLDSNLVYFAERDGETVGCAIVLPNFNPMIKRAGGSVGPGFLWEFLFNRGSIDTFRGYAIGIRKAHRNNAEVSSLLVHALTQMPRPWKAAELSWILSNNRPMNLMALGLGGRRSKIYRIYEGPPLKGGPAASAGEAK